MNAKDIILRNLLEGRIQLQIPIYQRTYDWNKQNCRQLYDDIVNAGRAEKFHFIGAITRSGGEDHPVDMPRYQIIDGQQRITSIMLLLRALQDTPSVPDELKHRIGHLLFNTGEKKAVSDRYKLVLTGDSDVIFRNIMEDGKTEASSNVAAGFSHFKKWLTEDRSHDLVWKGLQGLTAVSILLDKSDDAQAIFESMNSTGLALSMTDLIQNYMLMGGKPDWQERVYYRYWMPMEQQFEEMSVDPDKFFRCYLSMRLGEAVAKGMVYKRFKEYAGNSNREKEIIEIHRHFKHYVELVDTLQHSGHPLRKEIGYACDQDTDVADPLLLKVLADYATGTITENDAKEVFVLIGSYLLRSRVCGTLTGANKRLPELIRKIDEKPYAQRIGEALMAKRGAGRFPRDAVFKEELERFPLYTNSTVCRYVLVRLEHGNDRETIDPDSLNIEHIMPQKLDGEWKRDLGGKYEEVHEKYLHTVGNLTLTAFNPELGNLSFSHKRGTYKDSKVTITQELARFEKWGENEIINRAERLAEDAVSLWRYPKGYDNLATVDRYEYEYDRALEENHLEGKNTVDLWYVLKREILSTCPGTTFYMNKHYGSFRLPADKGTGGGIVCSLESLRNRIHVTYGTSINDGVIKPSDFVTDVSTVGHYGSGHLRTTIATEDDVSRVSKLAKDVWKVKSRP